MAPVTVRNTKGDIVNGLTPFDFELYDNGKLQKITEDAASHPMSMVVAVQSSANMVQEPCPAYAKSEAYLAG